MIHFACANAMTPQSEPSKFILPDGAKLEYEIFGLQQGKRPIVLITGRGCLKSDWGRLVPSLSRKRSGVFPVLKFILLWGLFDNRLQSLCMTIGE